MAKITDEDKNSFKKNLDYLGLNLDKIPKALLDFEPLGFSPSNTYNENEHRVFKYIPINKIYILLTPTNRLNDIKEKYNKPGNVYLGLVHRLDRPVGGVMVFAKTSKAASRLSNQVREKTMKKQYLAVVDGKIEKQKRNIRKLFI